MPDDHAAAEEHNDSLYAPIAEEHMPIPPWERSEKESDPAWEAFQNYRDAGAKRSIRTTAATLDKSATLVGRWNSRYRWRERVIAWDYELDRVAQAEITEEARKMATRHAQQAQGALAALSLPVQAWLKKVQAAQQNEEDLAKVMSEASPKELIELIQSVTLGIQRMQTAERLARGEPTEITYAQDFVVPVGLEAGDDDTSDMDAGTLAGVLAGLEQAGLVRRPAVAEGGVSGPGEGDSEDPEPDSG